jgi:hypothetical protein
VPQDNHDASSRTRAGLATRALIQRVSSGTVGLASNHGVDGAERELGF